MSLSLVWGKLRIQQVVQILFLNGPKLAALNAHEVVFFICKIRYIFMMSIFTLTINSCGIIFQSNRFAVHLGVTFNRRHLLRYLVSYIVKGFNLAHQTRRILNVGVIHYQVCIQPLFQLRWLLLLLNCKCLRHKKVTHMISNYWFYVFSFRNYDQFSLVFQNPFFV